MKAAEASLEVYKLNLDFTKVTSPIDGQVSRYYFTLGNLVNQDQTVLTTVVSLDPIYAYFDVDEPTVLRVRRAINEGTIKRYQEGRFPSHGLARRRRLSAPGNHQLRQQPGQSHHGQHLGAGLFDNPKPPKGVRLLSPGMFVRIRLPIGQPHPALLVIDRAIGRTRG